MDGGRPLPPRSIWSARPVRRPVFNASGGDGQVTVNFTNPLNNGGAAIVSYAVTCNPGAFSVSPAVSPAVVAGLTNGTQYTCDVTANNGFFTGPAASASATPQPPLALTAIFSRKTHGAAGDFNIELFDGEPDDGDRDIEPRAIGGGFRSLRSASTGPWPRESLSIQPLDGNPVAGSAALSLAGNEVIVNVSGIPDNSIYRIAIGDVDGQSGFNVAANVAFLVGELNGSRAVKASDISAVKANLGQVVKDSTFRFDLNADGTIGTADLSAVKARSGRVLP